jgi:hypothetical protein
MGDNNDKEINNDAHTIALELLKQIITLSSGIIVLSATFIKDIFSNPFYVFIPLFLSWIVFSIAIIYALNCIDGITQSRIENDDRWKKGATKNEAGYAKTFFIIGIIVFMIFALTSSLSMLLLKKQNIQEINVTLKNDLQINEINTNIGKLNFRMEQIEKLIQTKSN